jgi:uncharacterized protein YndB with AHSA1/START domain
MRNAIIAVIMILCAPLATAEVRDSASNGFTTVNEIVVDATRAEAWVAAIDISKWWSSDHTISGDAARMSIEPRTLGCFCESLGEEAGIVHLTVTSVMPTVLLRMTGGLGPLGLMGVDGNMTWEFEDVEAGTRVRFTYAVGGYMAGGLDQVAGPVDGVLGEALARLKAYVETGKPGPVTIE